MKKQCAYPQPEQLPAFQLGMQCLHLALKICFKSMPSLNTSGIWIFVLLRHLHLDVSVVLGWVFASRRPSPFPLFRFRRYQVFAPCHLLRISSQCRPVLGAFRSATRVLGLSLRRRGACPSGFFCGNCWTAVRNSVARSNISARTNPQEGVVDISSLCGIRLLDVPPGDFHREVSQHA